MKQLLTVAFMLIAAFSLTAQQKVNGKVTDSAGEPLPGVTIMQKGTSNGVATNVEGNFTIVLQSGKPASITATYVGYKPAEKAIAANQTNVTIVMNEEASAMDELVVVGYGQQKKVNLTGAVDQVSSEVFEGRPTANVAQMLTGVIPNLNITLSDGKPNRSANFNVRGTGSVNGGSALVLVDGVETNTNLINPADIESVSVLKDAASSAIYGARAPYGVVLITTKNASKGKPKISYSSNYSWANPENTPDVVTDGYTWVEHFAEAYYGHNHNYNVSKFNTSGFFSLAYMEEYKKRKEEGTLGTYISGVTCDPYGPKGNYVYFNDQRDVYGELYKKNVFSTTQNLSISGSDDKFDYYISGRYYHYDGLYNSKDHSDKHERYSLRFKAGYKMTPWLKIMNNAEINHNNYFNPRTYSNSGTGNIYQYLNLETPAAIPTHNPDGTLTRSGMMGIGDMLEGNSGITFTDELFRNTVSFEANIWKNHVTLKGDFTYKKQLYTRKDKLVRTAFAESVDNEGNSNLTTLAGVQSSLQLAKEHTDYINTNIYANFNYKFIDKHDLGVLVGYNYEKFRRQRLTAKNDDLLTNDVEDLQLALGTDNKTISSAWNAYQFGGAFFRVNYAFDDRYLVEFNGRYDGSSRFPSNHRWAFFPSASIGWRINNESFWHVDPKIISSAKIRASYGKLGNGTGLSNYQYKQTMSVGTTSEVLDGIRQLYLQAPGAMPADLTWEKSATIDIGGDLAFLNRRLTISGDWYKRKTTDMIIAGPTVPDVFGASSPKGNYADLSTYGYELAVEYRDHFKLAGKNFNWSVRATLSDYYSVIDKYNNATKSLNVNSNQSGNSNYYTGMRIGEMWGFLTDGFWTNKADIDAAEAAAKAAGQKYYNPIVQTSSNYKLYPGDIKYLDLNGNGYIDRGSNTADNPGDRRIIGNSEPRYIYGFQLNADWNGIWVSASFQGVGKQDWYPGNESAAIWGQYNRPYALLPKWHLNNYWTEDNQDAYLPRYSGYHAPFYRGIYAANDKYLQNVSYIRLRNLQVGYNLPSKWTSKVKMQEIGIYFSGENLWTWSPLYKHTKDINVANITRGDTELGTGTGVGDGYNYPSMRTLSLGINITF